MQEYSNQLKSPSETPITLTLSHKFSYGIDENGEHYTEITTSHTSSTLPGVNSFPSIRRYEGSLDLMTILDIVKADEVAWHASLKSLKRDMDKYREQANT